MSLRLSFICILTAEGESHCFGGELGGDTGGPFITPRGIGGWDTLQRVLFQALLPEGEGDNPSVFPKDGRNWEWINSLGDGPQSLLHLPPASISRSRGQHGQHAWAWAAGTASPCSPITLQHSIRHSHLLPTCVGLRCSQVSIGISYSRPHTGVPCPCEAR